MTEIPRENERFAATSIPIPFEDLKQTGLKVDIAEMSTFSPVGSLSSNGVCLCVVLFCAVLWCCVVLFPSAGFVWLFYQ